MKREKPHVIQATPGSLIEHGDLAMMSQGAPQKIFLWDKQGNYQDCAFPNPIYGHFLGGQGVKGKNIQDVLEPSVRFQLLETIQQTIQSGKPARVNLALFGAQSAYKTVVCIFPLSELIMGWVNDYPIAETPDVPLNGARKIPAGNHKTHIPRISCSSVSVKSAPYSAKESLMLKSRISWTYRSAPCAFI